MPRSSFLWICIIVPAILAVDFVLAYRDPARRGRTAWHYWPRVGLGSAFDAGVGLVVGIVTWGAIMLIMRVEFTDRGAFLAAIWPRLPRIAVNFIACALGVLGGSAFRRLVMCMSVLANMRPRRCIQIGVCLLAAALLYLSFVEHGGGFYERGKLPPQAWFAIFGEYGLHDDRPKAYNSWYGPRLSTMKYGDLVCLVGGIIAPTALLGAVVFLLAKEFKDARGRAELA